MQFLSDRTPIKTNGQPIISILAFISLSFQSKSNLRKKRFHITLKFVRILAKNFSKSAIEVQH
jgi:hypothetical protein